MIDHEQEKQRVWELLFKHDGNRQAVADEMRISLRSLYRRISDYDLYPMIDKMGWTERPGPARKVKTKGRNLARQVLLATLRERKGDVDLGDLAVALYGEDTVGTRNRVLAHLEDLEATFDGKKWSVPA